MKGVKLKPLFLKEDDILIGPPEVLKVELKHVTKIEDLPGIIRGRKLKKPIKKNNSSEDVEQVKKLSNFRSNSVFKSPIRRFTFKRLGTIRINENSTPHFSSVLATSVINTKKQTDSISSIIQSLLTSEKSSKIEINTHAQKISNSNKKFQKFQEEKYQYLLKELKGYSRNIKQTSEEINEIEDKMLKLKKTYDKEHSSLNAQEARQIHHISLLKQKGGNRNLEINSYLVERERLRGEKEKSSLAFFEELENVEKEKQHKENTLEKVREQKIECKKDLESIRLTLVNFYCNALKQGIDIREDGLTWPIKALWMLKEPVPFSAFPKYIDELSVCFILQYARSDIEVQHYQKELEKLKHSLHENRDSNFHRLSKRQLFDNVKLRIRDISKSVISKKLSNSGENYFNHSGLLKSPSRNLDRHDRIIDLRKTIHRIKKEIDELAAEEVKRVAYDFKNNKGTQSVTFSRLLDCLLGHKSYEYKKFAAPR